MDQESSLHARLTDLSIEGAWAERLKHVPTGAFETVFGDPRNQTIDGDYYTRIRLDHEFENGIHLDASVSSSYYYYDGTYIYEDDPPTIPPSTYRFIDQIRGRGPTGGACWSTWARAGASPAATSTRPPRRGSSTRSSPACASWSSISTATGCPRPTVSRACTSGPSRSPARP